MGSGRPRNRAATLRQGDQYLSFYRMIANGDIHNARSIIQIIGMKATFNIVDDIFADPLWTGV